MIDALQFLEEHRNWRFPYFKDTPLRQRIAWRRLGFSAWRAGAISFRDAMQNLLSSAGKSQSLMKRMWAFANAHFMDDIRAQNLHQEGIAVFGRPFNLASEREETLKWIATFKTLNETIAADQYQTKKYLRPNSTVVDAGANIGAFSVLSGHLCPEGAIYAFEPVPSTCSVLRKNCSPYRNIHVYEQALGETEKESSILMNLETLAASALQDSGMPFDTYPTAPPQKVSVTTVDALELPRLDFMKLDVEGYCGRVIAGAKESIRKYRPVIVMEIDRPGTEEEEIKKLVNAVSPGYHFIKRYATELLLSIIPQEKL
ncbi:MAG: hypothetical protein A2946_02135 [Candidatus Liptonbacteria bacterium RIFCSPLOWO2_01_FULL_53_13]|uniref:Methyltransferase FkbM domain-containing protein n=1 Tax=Candidatus Liptonbacteria bacterium RIFCSPLOWO2_01_FULL_53_13 TaxID=1798651 RepID=A0A1G2CMH4_9BACT|nr:MAG: hypothetical protein A2946_02135 [Candidatus Liptonbacteria bacterium RIFCSPLOWO2_01_FULL_53_13]